jgi:hypothetical protein
LLHRIFLLLIVLYFPFLRQHTLATYPYQSVITFGGYRDDFMAVVSQQREPGAPKKSVEKLVFSLAKPKVSPTYSPLLSVQMWSQRFLSAGPCSLI